jgi:hypothetical protein
MNVSDELFTDANPEVASGPEEGACAWSMELVAEGVVRVSWVQ